MLCVLRILRASLRRLRWLCGWHREPSLPKGWLRLSVEGAILHLMVRRLRIAGWIVAIERLLPRRQGASKRHREGTIQMVGERSVDGVVKVDAPAIVLIDDRGPIGITTRQ